MPFQMRYCIIYYQIYSLLTWFGIIKSGHKRCAREGSVRVRCARGSSTRGGERVCVRERVARERREGEGERSACEHRASTRFKQ